MRNPHLSCALPGASKKFRVDKAISLDRCSYRLHPRGELSQAEDVLDRRLRRVPGPGCVRYSCRPAIMKSWAFDQCGCHMAALCGMECLEDDVCHMHLRNALSQHNRSRWCTSVDACQLYVMRSPATRGLTIVNGYFLQSWTSLNIVALRDARSRESRDAVQKIVRVWGQVCRTGRLTRPWISKRCFGACSGLSLRLMGSS